MLASAAMSVLILCFVVGLAVRALRGVTDAMAGSQKRSGRQPRYVGRDWSEEVPTSRRRRGGSDDRPLPLGRGRR